MFSYIAGTAAFLASTGTASGAVVHQTHNQVVDRNNPVWTVDLDGDGNDDFDFVGCACSVAAGYSIYSTLFSDVSSGPLIHPGLIGPATSWVPYSYLLYAGSNSSIDPDTNLPVYAYFESPGGSWTGTADGVLGIKFEREAAPGDITTHYGWFRLRVGVNPVSGAFAEILDSGWETLANTAVAVPVPEPGPLGLLAAGILGLAAWRKRKATPGA
jgi:hypothetical protein